MTNIRWLLRPILRDALGITIDNRSTSSEKTTQNRLPIGFLSDYLFSGITAILSGSAAFRSILWQNTCFFAVKHYHLRKKHSIAANCSSFRRRGPAV